MRKLLCVGGSAALLTSVTLGMSTPAAGRQLAGSVNVPRGEFSLGTVEISRRVMADDWALPVGSV